MNKVQERHVKLMNKMHLSVLLNCLFSQCLRPTFLQNTKENVILIIKKKHNLEKMSEMQLHLVHKQLCFMSSVVSSLKFFF